MATRKTQTSQSKPQKAPKTTPPSASAPATAAPSTASYQHPEAKAVIRPEAGAQTRFKKKKPAATWRYDSSLAPELQWDDGHPAREQGEAHIARIQAAVAQMQATLAELQARLEGATATPPGPELQALLADARARVAQLQAEPVLSAQAAAAALQALSRPFLNWAGKAEHLSFEVPTLPLFIHERLSTQAILDSVAGQRRVQQADWISDFFGHPERTLPEQLMKAYEHPNGWQNRMVLGDSLVVMNSLLHFENLGGQVQMIYIDPPYGVRFGSNFQPFVRKRDVAHNDDEGFTREPEMVKAYRDTWELGLHSYLTYLRDRLLLARDLLTESGSVFVQISDENLHHVREVMDEVFGADNFCCQIAFRKTTGKGGSILDNTYDSLLWFARDKLRLKVRQLFEPRLIQDDDNLRFVELAHGERRRMTEGEAAGIVLLPEGARAFRPSPLTSARPPGDGDVREFVFEGKRYTPGTRTFSTHAQGLERLSAAKRLLAVGNTLTFIRYLDDFPFKQRTDIWEDTRQSGFADGKLYVVQTSPKAIERCMLMTTDPGDLVLDPTCGSGTTAVVAESWGRRWITIDTSRVPLALARQRLLTSTFTFHELKEPARGPAGGFVYREKKNRKGEHVGGIVPHITLGSIANGEPPKYEVLVDRPEPVPGITRVCGPFVFEATIPTASNFDGEAPPADPQQDAAQDFVTRMVEVLRASPVLHLPGGKAVQLSGIRRPAKTLYLSAEAVASSATGPAAASGSALDAAIAEADADNGGLALKLGEPVALLFGPEHGAIAEVAVLNAWQEATAKGFAHLYVIGFAIEPKARQSIGEYSAMGMPTTYVQATPDILMGDLLKNMRSSQIFSVCGQPDVRLATVPAPAGAAKNEAHYQVTLHGLDVFDPVTMGLDKRSGLDVPAWFLDTDYNGLVFRVAQAFFPRTQAWDNLKRALKTDFDDSVWAHLAGDTSAPFTAGLHGQIAVKVIDDRGNELMVVKKLEGAT
jgi:adenine-specific DNA-methyltransferase